MLTVLLRAEGFLAPRRAGLAPARPAATLEAPAPLPDALAGPFGATIGGGPATLKAQVLQLGAALDRGQMYNPTSGAQYSERMRTAVRKIEELVACAPPLPTSLDAIDGEWELVLSSVPHGIFRSSPFFLAVQEAFNAGEGTSGPFESVQDKSNLFFKLHELQTCSWGVSKIGRVAQRVDAASGYLFSEFDTTIFSLTVIPVLGWFKLLPTFGGCVITASKATLEADGKIAMEVDYTTSRPVPGLSGLGKWIWSIKVPVGAVWKLLPWNKGRAATCSVFLRYVDDDFRIVQDVDGEWFVYTRPVATIALSNEEQERVNLLGGN